MDETFDILCLQSGRWIVSDYFWTQRRAAELTISVITHVLNCSHPDSSGYEPFVEPLSETEIDAFFHKYPGPFEAKPMQCDYRGPGYEVFCRSMQRSVLTSFDYGFDGQAQLVANYVARLLNEYCMNNAG